MIIVIGSSVLPELKGAAKTKQSLSPEQRPELPKLYDYVQTRHKVP